MSKETINLTRALKEIKCKVIGELVLERVLEKSGLEKDENMRYSKALPPRKETVFS
jgi:DNA anti-recombination protein RmuC